MPDTRTRAETRTQAHACTPVQHSSVPGARGGQGAPAARCHRTPRLTGAGDPGAGKVRPSVAPQPAYAPLPGSEGDLRSTSSRRQGTLALERPNSSSAARPRLERGSEIPANSETEQQRTEAAGSGRGREAARRGAAHPPRNRGAAPSINPRFQPRAPAAPPQPRSAPGSGAGTSDAERSFQSSDPLKKQYPLAGADGDCTSRSCLAEAPAAERGDSGGRGEGPLAPSPPRKPTRGCANRPGHGPPNTASGGPAAPQDVRGPRRAERELRERS
ncbi:myristoylated alanine-rich C-kinase substrate-like [Muntiacus reevesi]|uniref:myristoylated alanine-rich C-kinase substrate-like n=1 Tax=Muntiacus reevesi TaxID=9886 RepID=UPI0033073D79